MIIINPIINELLNDSYKVLKILYDNQVTINNETYCPLSQEAISKELGVTRVTIGNIMKRLKDKNLIIVEGSRKYILTNEAIKTIKKIQKI